MRRPFTPLSRLAPTAIVVALLSAPAICTAGDSAFDFERLNRPWHQDQVALAPIEHGGMVITVTTTDATVVLHGHRVTLTPLPDGTHRARLSADFSGRGHLKVTLDAGGVLRAFEDDLVLPRQQTRLAGRIRLDKVEGGYRVTALELPETVAVSLESRLLGTLSTTCRALALIPVIPIDCRGVAAALGRVEAPLPPPGTAFLLGDAELTAADRQRLDGYLAAGTAR